MEQKQRRNLLVTLLVVAGVLATAFVVLRNENTPRDVVMGREFVQDVKKYDMDVPDTLQLSENVERVNEQVGKKESLMDESEILSDGALTEADQIAMDKAQDDDEQDPVLVDEKEDGEEEDTGLEKTEDDDDADLDFLSDEEASKHAVAVESDRYPRPQCRRVRRCYHKYCSKRRCKRICRPWRVCRRVGRRLRCVLRRRCYAHCSLCRSRCGVICRLRTHCRRVPRVTCYNRYCVRRFCARRCVRRGVRCRRYRRCYRRCVGVCGRRNRRCYVRCYHYRRCHPLNRCYNHCFIRRRVCGRRCVRRRVRRACWANGALKLATDESGTAIPMKDVAVTKEQEEEMGKVTPDKEADKLMAVPDRYRRRWRRLPGRLTNVAISSLGTLYGVNAAQQIWTKRAWNRGRWIKLPGALKQISVNNAGTIVTGVNAGQQIWYTRVTVRNLGFARWASAPGRLVDVTSGGRFMYGVNSHDHIYRANLMNRNWCRLPGALVQISAHGSKVVGVNRAGQVWQYLGNGRWKRFGNAPRARWASMGRDGEFWVIRRNQWIYRLAGKRFQRIPGALVQIDVADRRNVVGVNAGQYIYQWV